MTIKTKLIFLIPFLILGCKPSYIDRSRFVQSIDNLNMNIYSNEGEKVYSVNSPKSIYDKTLNTFNLSKTTINLFNKEKLKYIINSNNSKLSNDNKLLELTGNVELRTEDQENEIVYSDIFIWNIEEEAYTLVGNVKFENNNIILISKKAILRKDNVIEFFNPVEYIIKEKNNQRSYEVNSENAFYNLETQSVSFKSINKRVRSKIYF